MKNNILLRFWVPVLVIASFLTGGGVIAQEALLEEIIVTAQKRQQNLQEVPIAVTAFTGKMLQDSGIKDIRELAAVTPSLISYQSQNSTMASFGVRGISTSAQNWGLEASVGLYVDGVYRSRQSSIMNNLVDVEAVEILRGPQGTLFGKNSSAGTILFRTVAPSRDANAFVEVTAGDYGLVNVSAARNITLTENMLMRGTFFSGQRDGYVSDIHHGRDVLNNRDRSGGRLQLLYTPTERLDIHLIADYAEIDEVCCAALTRVNNYAGVAGPGTDAFLAAGLGTTVIGGEQFNDLVTSLTYLPRGTNEDKGLSAEINYQTDWGTLTSISAYRSFHTTDFIDADFAEADLLTDENLSNQRSFSQELRLAGELGDHGDFVVGAYYFEQDLSNLSTLTTGPHTNAFFGLNPTLSGATAGVNALAPLAFFGLPYQSAAEHFPDNVTATDDMRQHHQTFALFGQADIELADNWTLTGGIRLTDERKQMHYDFLNSPLGPPPDLASLTAVLTGVAIWSINPAIPGALDPTNPVNVPTVLGAVGPLYVPGWGIYTQPSLAPQAGGIETFEDENVTGTLRLAYQPNDNMLWYLSYATGFKAGGTNTDRINPIFPQVFGPESSRAAEIGLKADLMDGRMRLNIAAHDTVVKGLQVNAFAGNGFNLQNAGEGNTHGVEVDMQWLVTETLNVSMSYAKNKAHVKDFANGTCWIATPWQTGEADPGQTDPTSPVCQRDGSRVSGNPENVGYVSATKNFRLGSSAAGSFRAEYTHVGETMTDGNGDPLKLREAFSMMNLRLSVLLEDYNTEIAVWKRNISDARFYETVFDVPVQDGKLNAYPHEPSTYGVTVRMNFE